MGVTVSTVCRVRRREEDGSNQIYCSQQLIIFFGVQTEVAFARRLHLAIFHHSVLLYADDVDCELCLALCSVVPLLFSVSLSLAAVRAIYALRFLPTRSPTHNTQTCARQNNNDNNVKKEPAWRQKRHCCLSVSARLRRTESKICDTGRKCTNIRERAARYKPTRRDWIVPT